jgi:hypothetical protein
VVKEEGVFPEQAIELGHDGVSHISLIALIAGIVVAICKYGRF